MESGYIAPPFFTSALDGDELPALHLGHFTSSDRATGMHWPGCLVGHRAGLDAVGRRRLLALAGNQSPSSIT
jgi:hypothetical protein